MNSIFKDKFKLRKVKLNPNIANEVRMSTNRLLQISKIFNNKRLNYC